MPKSIYLAGKIDRNDWRYSIVKGLHSAIYGDCSGGVIGGEYIDGHKAPEKWPVIPRAAFGLDYTGPYFIEDGHGCTFGPGEHGAGAVESDGRKSEVVKWCLDAIRRSDIVFVWIDDTTCYGTLVEIGYAKALGKKIWIAGPDLSSRDVDKYGNPLNELWFAHKLADELVIGSEHLTPSAALKSLIPPQFDSPIEEKFWQVWMQMGNPYELTPQHPIGKYYVDFAYVPGQIAIELDGHATHSSPDAIAHDRKRQREIEAAGWKVIRFGGKEIYTDAYKCAKEALAILERFALKQKVDTGLIRIQQLQEKAKKSPQRSDIPMLTTDAIGEHWEYIERRIQSKKGGVEIAALLKEYVIVDIEGTRERPIVILQAHTNLSYEALRQYPAKLAILEWAMKVELKQECRVQLREPGAVACDACGIYMGVLEEDDIPICNSCWDSKMLNPRN